MFDTPKFILPFPVSMDNGKLYFNSLLDEGKTSRHEKYPFSFLGLITTSEYPIKSKKISS